MEQFSEPSVKKKFEGYSSENREALLKIRELIFDTSKELSPNEKLVESLKWNQPSYSSKNGTPIRLDSFGADKVAIFFHCQTHLIEQFREIFKEDLDFSKNRAIVIDPTLPLPIGDLKVCIQMGLTYHLS